MANSKSDHLANSKLLISSEDSLLGQADETNKGNTKKESYVCLTQVSPSDSCKFGDEEWKMSLEQFSSKKQTNTNKMPKRIRSYYKAQDKLITTYEKLCLIDNIDSGEVYSNTNNNTKAEALFYARLVLCVNVCLAVAKAVAVSLSGSISIISSLVDSCVDLMSGAIFWWTTNAMRSRNPYTYPQGRTKLEPIGIIIISVIMSLAAVQLILESVEKIVKFVYHSNDIPSVDLATIGIVVSTIVTKLVLYIACRRIVSPTVKTLAIDQRNDVLSNSVAILFGYIGSKQMFNKTNILELRYLDPLGAILISTYIFINWWRTGYSQIKLLTGYTAKPMFLSKITWITLNHNKNIKQIDTVRAFYFGNNFLVEVDIVLPEDMTLKKAHDIGESLQQKLERLPEVERAFVHLDYEVTHNPNTEHKVV